MYKEKETTKDRLQLNMDTNNIIYLVFGATLVVALMLDLGLLNKSNQEITFKKAMLQTLLWVCLSIAFWAFLWIEKNNIVATKYIAAYVMEWSLSVDNIFVFIIIFNFFKISAADTGRALLIGILLAIVLRIIFIAVGLELIDRFHWILYIFGAFLVYTGVKLFMQKDDEQYDPKDSGVYKFFSKYLRLTEHNPMGTYTIKKDGKLFFTYLSMVVLMLAITDIVFALDSIPTVVSLVRTNAATSFTIDDKIVIYSSNIFAVLGLRSLFFLLKGASNKFDYLQQGIAVILLFVGVKMLIEFFGIHIPIWASLLFIICALTVAIVYSIYNKRKGNIE
jgi:tellurite resistance protein TerC